MPSWNVSRSSFPNPRPPRRRANLIRRKGRRIKAARQSLAPRPPAPCRPRRVSRLLRQSLSNMSGSRRAAGRWCCTDLTVARLRAAGLYGGDHKRSDLTVARLRAAGLYGGDHEKRSDTRTAGALGLGRHCRTARRLVVQRGMGGRGQAGRMPRAALGQLAERRSIECRAVDHNQILAEEPRELRAQLDHGGAKQTAAARRRRSTLRPGLAVRLVGSESMSLHGE